MAPVILSGYAPRDSSGFAGLILAAIVTVIALAGIPWFVKIMRDVGEG